MGKGEVKEEEKLRPILKRNRGTKEIRASKIPSAKERKGLRGKAFNSAETKQDKDLKVTFKCYGQKPLITFAKVTAGRAKNLNATSSTEEEKTRV